MKTLQTYLIEAIKPPRLSAKNKHLWMHPTEEEVMKWLKENCNVIGKVEIVDGKINVEGTIGINDDVEFFPYPFGEVTGYFCCSECNRLKSLKNSPQKMGGRFNCSYCKKLTSLEGAPKEVGNNFTCSFCNNLTSLEGAPKEVGNNFNCSFCNNLTSLEGAPEEVGGSFFCYDCGKEFTKKDVRKVSNVKKGIYA